MRDVVRGSHGCRLRRVWHPRGMVGGAADDRSLRARLQQAGTGRVVPMRMGHDDLGNPLAGQPLHKGVDMLRRRRSGVDNSDFAVTYDVGASAAERHRSWVGS